MTTSNVVEEGYFTDRARKVLFLLAEEEAKRFNHNYIGTEHLLLGLLREGDGVAARVLGQLGVTFPKVRSAVEFIIGRGVVPITTEIELTPRAKKTIGLASDEARRLNHRYIGTEHLLLGLVREGGGIAVGVLESMNVNLEKVRQATLAVVTNTPERLRERPYLFTDEDYTQLDALLLKIPREHIVLFVTGRVSFVGFLQAYTQLFGIDFVTRLSQDKWAMEHLKGHCQELTQAYWDRLDLGPCPTNDQLLYGAVRGLPAGPHVEECEVCGPLYRFMQSQNRESPADADDRASEIGHKGGQASHKSWHGKRTRKKADQPTDQESN